MYNFSLPNMKCHIIIKISPITPALPGNKTHAAKIGFTECYDKGKKNIDPRLDLSASEFWGGSAQEAFEKAKESIMNDNPDRELSFEML